MVSMNQNGSQLVFLGPRNQNGSQLVFGSQKPKWVPVGFLGPRNCNSLFGLKIVSCELIPNSTTDSWTHNGFFWNRQKLLWIQKNYNGSIHFLDGITNYFISCINTWLCRDNQKYSVQIFGFQ
jgi:hypothetical protein